MSKQINDKGVVYTIRRTYKSTYSVDELISSIIQTHYYDNDTNKTVTPSEEEQHPNRTNGNYDTRKIHLERAQHGKKKQIW